VYQTMGIQVAWENNAQETIHLTFQPGWAWDDLYAAVETADQMIDSVPQKVHLIIDVSHAGGIPSDFLSVAGKLFASGKARPNEGTKVVVGASPFIRMAYGGLSRIYPSQTAGRPLRFAANVDEAHTLLATNGSHS
jgi:hypothetical protein